MKRPSSFRKSNPLGGRASSSGLFRGSGIWRATDEASESPEASSEPPVVRVIEMTEVVANGNTKVVQNPLLNARRSMSKKAPRQAVRKDADQEQGGRHPTQKTGVVDFGDALPLDDDGALEFGMGIDGVVAVEVESDTEDGDGGGARGGAGGGGGGRGSTTAAEEFLQQSRRSVGAGRRSSISGTNPMVDQQLALTTKSNGGLKRAGTFRL